MIVDRLEGGWAVLEKENGEIERMPLTELPKGIREGDVLVFDGAWHLDPQGTLERRQRVQEKMARLKRRER